MSTTPQDDDQRDETVRQPHDAEWMERYGYFLTEEFEQEAFDRLVRAREDVIESIDVTAVDESVRP